MFQTVKRRKSSTIKSMLWLDLYFRYYSGMHQMAKSRIQLSEVVCTILQWGHSFLNRMNWIFQHWMNRMKNDGIIEWHRPLVSNNHGEKWRRNRSSWLPSHRSPLLPWARWFPPRSSSLACFFFFFFFNSVASFDRSTRSSSRHPAWETKKKKTPVSPSVQIWLGALAFFFGATQTTSTSAGERETIGWTCNTNSGSADETKSETRTRKTRQAACSRKRIWKARAWQKSPRVVLEADLWKMLKNSTPWVWLMWIEFFSIFQHFSAFWKLMNAHFSKNSC